MSALQDALRTALYGGAKPTTRPVDLQHMYFTTTPPGQLSAPHRNYGEKLSDAVAGGLRKIGLSNRMANKAAALPSYTPVAGITSSLDLGDDLAKKEYGSALLSAVDTGLNFLPDGGGALAMGLGAVGQGALRAAPRGAVLERYLKGGSMLDMGSLHSPYGMVKMARPHSEQTSVVSQLHDFSKPSIVRPEDFEGSTLVPFVGDRSATGKLLHSVNGRDLVNPVALDGGARYGHQHSDIGSPGVWASHGSVLKGILDNARGAGGEVHGVYSAMGPRGVDFSTMMANSVLEQLGNSPISRKALKSFDRTIKATHPDFIGISDPSRYAEVSEQLLNSSNLRKSFVKGMDAAPLQATGFPDIAATRYAMSDHALRDAPAGTTGLTVAKIDHAGDIIRQPTVRHTTYPAQLGGQFEGGFEVPLAREDVFPDFFAKKRAAGLDPYGDRRAFEIGTVRQPATSEWVDTLSKLIEQKKALGQGF